MHERDSGTTRWSLVHALPITDPAGDVLYAVNLFRDVTDRTVAAQEREQLLGSERTARAAAEEAAQMLTKLEEVTQAALAHVVQGDVLDEMLRQITRLVDADTSAILLLDEDGTFLTVRAALGFDREIEHAVPIPFGQGMAGRVAASAKPVVIRDLDQVELASPHLRGAGSPRSSPSPCTPRGG